MAALAAQLETRARREFWRAYMADTLCNIARGLASLGGGQYEARTYSAIMDNRPRDERTGAEIVNDVLEALERTVMG